MSDFEPTLKLKDGVQTQQPAQALSDAIDIAGIEVDGVIGKGAFGVVYRARQSFLNRIVAVKVIPVASASAEDPSEQRFRREAQILATLEHPNIVACYQAGVCTDQRSYLVMEFIDGPTLKEFVTEHGPLPIDIALRITAQLAKALQYALEHKIIHRDIKADNILLKMDPSDPHSAFPFIPKLADLGIARSVEIDPESDLTSVGTVVGTPSFMAPEQFNAPDKVGHKADIYGLGCMLYFLLTGQKPFTEKDLMKLLASKISGDYPNPKQYNKDIDDQVERLIRDMLQADSTLRISSYEDVIRGCLYRQTPPSQATRTAPGAKDKSRWQRLLPALSLLLLLAALSQLWMNFSSTVDTPAPVVQPSPEVVEPVTQAPPAVVQDVVPDQATQPESDDAGDAGVAGVAGNLPQALRMLQQRSQLLFTSEPLELISTDFNQPLQGWAASTGGASWFAEDEGNGVNAVGSGEQPYIDIDGAWRLQGSLALLTPKSREAGIRLMAADGRYIQLSIQQIGNLYLSIAAGSADGSGQPPKQRTPLEFAPLATKLMEHASFSVISSGELVEIEVNGRFVGSLRPDFSVRRFALFVDASTASFRGLRLWQKI